MPDARSPSPPPPRATRRHFVLAILIALALVQFWRSAHKTHTTDSASATSADVREQESGSRSDRAALVDPAPTAPIRTAAATAPETAPEERLALHVATRVALMPDSQAVPRIHVEVGYGTSFD